MNSLRSFYENPISSIHGLIFPTEVREGEPLTARIKSINSDTFVNDEVRIWRISPLGIELAVDKTLIFPKGLNLIVELKFGNQKNILNGLVVDEITLERGQKILHIRLVTNPEPRIEGIDRRASPRWICSEHFYPTAIAANPARFNDYIYFKVKDISFGGFKFQTSLRNKFIIPGLSMDCIVNFPMISQTNVKITVRNVRVEYEGGKEVLSVGVVYDTSTLQKLDIVGQYLLQFSCANSLDELHKVGFPVNKVSNAVNFTYVKTKEEFDEVLKLRFHAYKEAGKVQDGKTYMDMTDQFDSKSRIIIGKYNNEIVCSSRLIYHQLGESLEQENFIKWPIEMPRSDEVVEVMRACTRPDFRGGDLLLGMFKFIAVNVAHAKKKWIVMCATDAMAPFYEKLGFKKIDLSYKHPGLGGLLHHVMIANFADGMSGKSVNPIYWNIVWSDSVKHMSQSDLIEFDPFMQVRLSIYRWFQPVAYYFYQKKNLKKIQKKKLLSLPKELKDNGLHIS